MDAGKHGCWLVEPARGSITVTPVQMSRPGTAAAHIAVADAHAGDIGDGIERAGLQLAKLDIEVAGTWFHRFLSSSNSWVKKV
jgi:hypothetical protein